MTASRTQPVLDFATARAKVTAFIATMRQQGKHPWEIRDENTKELDGFWVFSWAVRSDYWPKRGYVASAGNCPIAVRKSDGVMFMWNLLCGWDEFVKRIESGELHPYGCRLNHDK
jgi:hypothetical protein